MDSLVSTEWLEDHAAGLVILDASRHLPDAARDARAEFVAAHIPGARFFDTSAPAAGFGAQIAAMGLSPDQPIVVYDNSALHSAARGWFLLHLHGFARVAVLDGGLAKWRSERRPLAGGEVAEAGATSPPDTDLTRLRDREDMLTNLADPVVPMLDARGPARFAGSEPEPRPGMAPGHIPGARNLPYAALYNPDGTMLSPEALATGFFDAGVDITRPFIASCGSGVTACSLLFAAHLLGHDTGLLYEPGWAEWGADPTLPKETGSA